MQPFFSIITPTLQRESLVRCCESVLAQTFISWEMIIQVDAESINYELFDRIHPTRKIWVEECGEHHGNYGNRCRHLAWKRSTGKYLIYLDDDNYLADSEILSDMSAALIGADFPEWAVFPIHRHGSVFFHDPPGLCMTDTLNIIAKRKIGRWPDITAREADGHWVEALKIDHLNYAAFPHFRPIGVMEHSSNGV